MATSPEKLKKKEKGKADFERWDFVESSSLS
jgi:hypothetical protein